MDIDTDILLCYLLTCDPPADVNGRTSISGWTPMWWAALYNNTSAVKVLIHFGGDRTIKTNSIFIPFPTRHLSISLKIGIMKKSLSC